MIRSAEFGVLAALAAGWAAKAESAVRLAVERNDLGQWIYAVALFLGAVVFFASLHRFFVGPSE